MSVSGPSGPLVYNSALVVCTQVIVLPVLLCGALAHRPEKWPDSMGQTRLINYRLIEECEGLFLPYCKLYIKCI